ncbi:MAG TPA: type II toxin-antitoxin system prevent-host-death family antitoxin [Thermoanaerobaculia bacterium]|nr:type II toxin-antitoxin system prevent-host-death family antitoxin [Thermoanaerobaculia bacterium]
MNRAVAKKPKRDLGGTLERVRRGERVVLRRGRKAVAAVVPIEDLKRLQELEDEEDLRDVCSALEEASRKGTIPWEKVKTELDRRPADAEANPSDERPWSEVRASLERIR